ncbi:MAG: hypothetical protein KIT57_16815 [Blastocatellales bacterium]|nr:hypothetical protein [Blastocatellales bacterium]
MGRSSITAYSFDGDHVYTTDPNDPPRESLTLKQLKRIESSAEVTARRMGNTQSGLRERNCNRGPTWLDGDRVPNIRTIRRFLNSYWLRGKEDWLTGSITSGKVRIELSHRR